VKYTTTNLLEAIYADDAIHGLIHSSASFVVGAIQFAAHLMNNIVVKHGLLLNFGPGKN
jgi:hypothetical protein